MTNAAHALTTAQSMAQTAEYLDQQAKLPADVAAALPTHFSAEVHLTYQKRQELPQGTSAYATAEELLDTSWDAAVQAGALRFYEGKVIFPIDAARPGSQVPIEVSIKQGDPERSEGRAWFVSYVNAYVPPVAAQAASPTKAIEDFAWMGPWEDFLEDLAAIALPESWGFKGAGARAAAGAATGRPYAILKSYVCNTYYRLNQEGKICVADDGGFAAFNSGLVDGRYDDIYLCFEPQAGHPQWRFVGFAASGNRALKKRVNKTFNPLPQTARYFDKLEDLLFDPSLELQVDYEHILLDNAARLPLDFYEQELPRSTEVMAIIDALRTCDADARDALYDELSDIIETDSRVYRTLRNRLEDAVDIARRRVRWNFKTAIPSYYPRANSMSLLLPLCLLNEQVADAALVVQLQESGIYQGQTILTIEQAYTNARLICRPDSDWLTNLG